MSKFDLDAYLESLRAEGAAAERARIAKLLEAEVERLWSHSVRDAKAVRKVLLTVFVASPTPSAGEDR